MSTYIAPKSHKYFTKTGTWGRVKMLKVSSYIAQYPILSSERLTLYFPGRLVQSNTISTSLGSIQPHDTINVRKAARTHIHHCLLPGIHLYSWVNWSNVEWTNLPKVLTPQHRIRTRVLLVESPKLYPWAIALFNTILFTPIRIITLLFG